MRRLLLPLAAAVLATTLATAPAVAQSPSRQDLQQLYVQFLTSANLSPSVDSDGDVRFRTGGKTYYIEVNEQDLPYFRLVLPNIWEIESEAERRKVLAAMDVANRRAKVAKLHLTSNSGDVTVSAELLLPTPYDFKAVFERAVSTIEFAVDVFVEEMRRP